MKTLSVILFALLSSSAFAGTVDGTLHTFSCKTSDGGTLARATQDINMYDAYQVLNFKAAGQGMQHLIFGYTDLIQDKNEFVAHGYKYGGGGTVYELRIKVSTNTGTFSYYNGASRKNYKLSDCGFTY